VIVTCEECQTQFQLDDSKVPEAGIRVRCSRCKCAFFVESPNRPAPDHASQLAREALGADPAHGSLPLRDATAPDEESDWQFNEEVAPSAADEEPANDLAAARTAVDDLLGGASSAPVDPVTGEAESPESSESPFGQFADEPNSTDLPDSPFGNLADEPDLDIGGTDFSADSELESEAEDDPNAVTLDRGALAGSSADLSSDPGPDLAGASVAQSAEPSLGMQADAAPPSAVDSAESFGEVSEDLGSPAGWDFFEDNDGPASAGFAPVSESLGAAESDADAGSDAARAFAASDYASECEVEASRGDVWFTHLRGVLGWALVAALCAYATTISLFPQLLAAAPDPMSLRLAGLEVVHVEGHWVENAAAGPIYVVSGAFHSAGGTRPAPGSLLQIRLIDAHGAEVASESAAVGPPIPTRRLRESNLNDLLITQQRAAPAMLQGPLERRKRRPFMAVLAGIPDEAVAFDLELATITAPPPDPIVPLDAATESDGRAVAVLAGEVMPTEAPIEAPIGVPTGLPTEVPTTEAAAPAEMR
jgi:predicted Zn finger-like uncharacterized protein